MSLTETIEMSGHGAVDVLNVTPNGPHDHHDHVTQTTEMSGYGDVDVLNFTTLGPHHYHDHVTGMGGVSSHGDTAMINATTAGPHSHHDHMFEVGGQDAIGDGHSGHSSLGSDRGGGHASFYTFDKNFNMLLRQWSVVDTHGLVMACIATFLLAVFYELFKNGRQLWIQGFFSPKRKRALKDLPVMSGGCCSEGDDDFTFEMDKYFWTQHVIQSVLYTVQVAMSIVLMLIAMTFNVYLSITLFAGEGFGYFISGAVRRFLVMRKSRKGEYGVGEAARAYKSPGLSNPTFVPLNDIDTAKV